MKLVKSVLAAGLFLSLNTMAATLMKNKTPIAVVPSCNLAIPSGGGEIYNILTAKGYRIKASDAVVLSYNDSVRVTTDIDLDAFRFANYKRVQSGNNYIDLVKSGDLFLNFRGEIYMGLAGQQAITTVSINIVQKDVDTDAKIAYPLAYASLRDRSAVGTSELFNLKDLPDCK